LKSGAGAGYIVHPQAVARLEDVTNGAHPTPNLHAAAALHFDPQPCVASYPLRIVGRIGAPNEVVDEISVI